METSDIQSAVHSQFDVHSSAVARAESKIGNVKSLNHFVRPRQHIRRNRQPNLLGGFQIDDEE